MTKHTIQQVHGGTAWQVLRDGATLITTHSTAAAEDIAREICDALNAHWGTVRRASIRELLQARRDVHEAHNAITERVRVLMPEWVGKHSQCCPLGGMQFGLACMSGETPCPCGADPALLTSPLPPLPPSSPHMCEHGTPIRMVCGYCLTAGRAQVDRDRAAEVK